MLRRAVLLVVALAAGACGGSDGTDQTVVVNETTTSSTATPPRPGDGDGTVFTWVTTMDLDGYGYTLTVEGDATDEHARYTMQVEPFSGQDGGDNADFNAVLAGAAVNGLVEEGAETTLETIDPDGRTEVVVLGDDRWYRMPWLLDEADFAMQGAEWVHVGDDEPFIADLATYVLVERYDTALRAVLTAVADGARLQAPRPADDTELDLVDPWLGLAGPGRNGGSPAVLTGDEGEGSAEWEETLTYEPDGADGRLGAEVTWRPGGSPRPDRPDPADVIEVTVLAERLSQAG